MSSFTSSKDLGVMLNITRGYDVNQKEIHYGEVCGVGQVQSFSLSKKKKKKMEFRNIKWRRLKP